MKLSFYVVTILFMFNLFLGCSSFGHRSPLYVKLAHEITEHTAKKLKEQKNLVLIGTGGQMMHKIEMLAMSFNYFQEVDLKSARDLTIYAINEYLFDINNKKEVRPYLSNYPFTPKNIEIMIFIYGPDRRELSPEKIYCITSIDGILEYYTRSDRDHPICQETYEEALKLVKN